MNQQEKFEARMKTLEPNVLATIQVITNGGGHIILWDIKDQQPFEGNPDNVDYTLPVEEQTE